MTDFALFATATGGRRHIRHCPHLLGKEALPAPADDTRPICDFCQKEIDGVGRQPFTDLDLALDAFKAPVQSRPLIKQALAGVVWDELWIPYSGTYVALGREGRGVAWVLKSYVELADRTVIELPGYNPSERAGNNPLNDAWGALCPKTMLSHPLKGSCDDCGASAA